MAYYFGSFVLIVSGLILLPFSKAIQTKTTEIEVTVVDNIHHNYIRDEGLFEYSYIWHQSLHAVFSWHIHTLEHRRLLVRNTILNCPYMVVIVTWDMYGVCKKGNAFCYDPPGKVTIPMYEDIFTILLTVVLVGIIIIG